MASAATASTAATAAADASAPDGDGGAAVVLDTKPILHVQLKRAEVLCLDWSPHEPNLLLAGASDGEVAFPSLARSPAFVF